MTDYATPATEPRRGLPAVRSLLPDSVAAGLHRLVQQLAGLALLALGLAVMLALAGYSADDPSWNMAAPPGRAVSNWLDNGGAVFADLALQCFGGAAIGLAVVPAVWGWRLLRRRRLGRLWARGLGLLLLLPALALLLAPWPAGAGWAGQTGLGGAFGVVLWDAAMGALAGFGMFAAPAASAAAAAATSAAVFLALGLPLQDWAALGRTALRGAIAGGRFAYALGRWMMRIGTAGVSAAVRLYRDLHRRDRGIASAACAPAPVNRDAKAETPLPTCVALEGVQTRSVPPVARKPEPLARGRREAAERQGALDLPAVGGEYDLPPLDLLQRHDPNNRTTTLDDEALQRNAVILEGVLGDFGVRGEIVRVNPGPVVTLYELEPAPGTKSSRVIGLADDIARSMSAVSVRVAVVPGKNAIGVELPNARREIVYLREILASKTFEAHGGKLAIVLGKDIGGTPVLADLARMPHLLVAGTTGSGKSVAVNTMILSLLFRLPPDKVRLILVDPKMLELSVYEGIPHLLSPVVTDPRKAVVALKWAVREMEDRYRAMSKLGVRNIEGYNQRLRDARNKGETLMRRVQTGFDPDTGKPVHEDEPLDLTELPYIVVVVDEMADLMLVAGKDIEAAIQRLAQMARAAGIHLIMATQRPSVDVITGTIKANFPTRVSFQVTSKIDSRTILGEGGAEQLLGLGDMLYMQGGGRITRVHGPFVSDGEVEAVVRFLKSQGEPAYNDAVLEDDDEAAAFDALAGEIASSNGGSSSGEALLYDQAVALVARERKASTSFIQRHLQIGYNRAARLIERMEAEGVVSRANHVGKREVLVRDHSGDSGD